MCDTCGCNDNGKNYSLKSPGENSNDLYTHHHNPHEHSHHHDHSDHNHEHAHKTIIDIEIDVLRQNNLLAERNRGYFEAKNIYSINFVSSPGSGKTTLLEKILNELKDKLSFAVVEGDQQTTNDADRIHATGAPVIQVNTGNGCHLDAKMINDAVKQLSLKENTVLFIENVGNLVCPALFDLGEQSRIVIVSVTEGEDKPLKYPYMFQSSHVCIINKIDLLPYLDFDIQLLKKNALKVNHHLKFIECSAKTGEGMDSFKEWMLKKSKK